MLAKVVKTLLDSSTALNTLIPIKNRYPYVISANTKFPAMVYTIDTVEPFYDKDGWVQDECEFTTVVFTDNYTSLQNIAKEVRDALELKIGTISGITIRRIYLTAQEEAYNIDESCFLNKMTFLVEVIGY